MLSVTNISLRRGRKVLIENAVFQIHAGQRMGVIGANGCGKSSLFAMILGQLEPDGGRLSRDPNDIVAHVAQHDADSNDSAVNFVMDGDRELREVRAALESYGHCHPNSGGARESDDSERSAQGLYERMEAIDGYTAESRAARLLYGLGFSADECEKPVGEFSGGWRMRLSLAQALMCRSDILLLDEPTNHLDLPAIVWLERWLKRYPGILLIISHDRDFLDQVCTRIAHIEHKTLHLFSGNYSMFESQRAEQLAQQHAMHSRQQQQIKHVQSYVERFRYKASKARQAQSRLKMLERMEKIAPAHVDSPFRFHFRKPQKQPQHLLGLTDASVGYDETVVLDNINLSLRAGDRIGLLGVNGAGKSTLVKALSSGSTLLHGERLLSKDTRIGYFAQHQLELLRPEHSPLDHLRDYAPHDREQDHRDYLGRFGFNGERIFEPVRPFSGGEKARLVLALMIRQGPNLLLLDEPTNHLDLEMRQALSVALIEYTGALIVISHDRHLLRSVCDELLIVHEGVVDRFERSIDDYPTWLREQQEKADQNAKTIHHDTLTPPNKRQKRQQQALQRQRLKPLYDKVKDIEKKLATCHTQLKLFETDLADEALYTDANRTDELKQLLKDQAKEKTDIDSLECDWLEVSEKIEEQT